MKKVTTEMEALKLCEEHQCKILFRNQSYQTPKHVVVELGISYEIIGKDLVEAVNRLVEVYHTPPVKHHELSWWKEHEEFYLPPSRKTV